MSAVFAWPAELPAEAPGLALTFVLPARACNLRCGFCAIDQRQEIAPSPLTPQDYAHFLSDVAQAYPLSMAAIQGYEPLLAESWPYVEALADAARAHRVPLSMVTNGILLAQRAEQLAALRPAGITVSLDSGDPATHDELRGRQGAFLKTVSGIRVLRRHPAFEANITVASVLMPGNHAHLLDLPRVLAKLGVRHWSINPLLAITETGPCGPVASSQEIVDALAELNAAAKQANVTLVLDDELGQAGVDCAELTVRRFERPDGLLRLGPSGACSVGKDILRPVDGNTPVWHPAEARPRDFVRALKREAV